MKLKQQSESFKNTQKSLRPHIIAMTAHAREAEGQVALMLVWKDINKPIIDIKNSNKFLRFYRISKVNKIESSA